MKEVSDKYGVYIHIPYCASKCAYCSFVSSSDFSDMDRYIEGLKKEIRERAQGRKADSVFIGGGTPSVLKKGALSEILSHVRQNFDLDEKSEITVECNPDSGTDEFFSECEKSGVNRVSIGLQSASDDLLKRVGRRHNFSQFLSAVACARTHGINNISADIMLGLPGQTEKDALDTVNTLMSLRLPHISAYGLSVEDNTPLQKSGYRPDEDVTAAMYESCHNALKGGGYKRYEVSNFAREGYECKHNLKYWTGAPYIGFGAAAHSYYEGCRYENTPIVKDYISGKRLLAKTELSLADRMEERIMLSLRTARGLDLSEFRKEFGVDLRESRKEQIARLLSLNAVYVEDEILKLSESAYYMMNAVIVSLI